jgi:hypothetical protein
MAADGGFTYTPPANFNGVDYFIYTASDGTVTATALVAIDVTAAEDAPLATDDGYTTIRDANLKVAPDKGLLLNDLDADGDDLSVTTTGIVASDNGGQVTVAADGGFEYLPSPGFSGIDTFDYTFTDGNGLFDAATVRLFVN